MAGRLALVVILFLAGFIVLARFAPNQYEVLSSAISERLFETIFAGTLTTILVMALVYVITGAKNENTRWALRFVLLEKWAVQVKRRHLTTALKTFFDESYDQLVGDLGEMSLQVDHAIAEGVVVWLKNHSESHRYREKALSELRQAIVVRCELFDEYIGVVNQHLNEIPVELRETADGIKNNVIEEHMSRIRRAATSVKGVKLDVERITQLTINSP